MNSFDFLKKILDSFLTSSFVTEETSKNGVDRHKKNTTSKTFTIFYYVHQTLT